MNLTYTQVLESYSGLGQLPLVFTWHGSAYIEVAVDGCTASEVINVWDYETDKPRIARTRRAFEAKCRSWVREYPEESLVHDVTENW